MSLYPSLVGLEETVVGPQKSVDSNTRVSNVDAANKQATHLRVTNISRNETQRSNNSQDSGVGNATQEESDDVTKPTALNVPDENDTEIHPTNRRMESGESQYYQESLRKENREDCHSLLINRQYIDRRTPGSGSKDSGLDEGEDYLLEDEVVATDALQQDEVVATDALQQDEHNKKTKAGLVEYKKTTKTASRSPDGVFWNKIFIIFAILDVLLVATISVLLGVPSQLAGQSDLRHHGDCLDMLKCDEVYLTQDDKRDNIYNFTIKGNMCCSTNRTALIQKYVIKHFRTDQAKAAASHYQPQRTAVHLILDLHDDLSKTKGFNQTLKWKKEGSLINGNLSLSSDRSHIEVKRDGIYFISPKVVFKDSMGNVGDKDLDPMLLHVLRVRSNNEQLLLENKHTHCANLDATCDIPSSSQGVFKMKAGDKLTVRVTKPCGLVLNQDTNYIDVYMI